MIVILADGLGQKEKGWFRFKTYERGVKECRICEKVSKTVEITPLMYLYSPFTNVEKYKS